LEVLKEITGEFGVLEVINSGSVFEIPKKTLEQIREVVYEKDIKILYFEIFYSYLSRLDEIINYFNEKKKVEIRFRTGIESFNNDFRRNVYKKNILLDEKKIKELSEKIYSVCLLIATQGQTKEMIKNDIEMGLKYFKAITINVFVDNGTVVKRDAELVKLFVQDMKHLFDNDRVEILIDNKDKKNTCIVVGYDNEEIGSHTIQGADSPTLANILGRISNAMDLTLEEHEQAIAKSFVISNDAAHSIHPNYLEKADPTNEPKINCGPVIKMAANKSYITDGYSRAVIEKIAKDAKIPLQVFVNRSDVRGGSTIGPIQQSQIRIQGIDIGSPLLSMHSVRELGGVEDHYNLYKLISELFKN